MAMRRTLYGEGRCQKCGRRVTVAQGELKHLRDGVWCGPVETHHPSATGHDPHGHAWRVTA